MNQPQSFQLRPFRIFSKTCGDIRSSRFATGVSDTGGKWKKSSIRKILIIWFGHLWVVEETYIFKFLPSSSLSGVSSLILFPLFAAGVVETGGNLHLDLGISLRIFEKIRKGDPNVIIRGLGEGDS
jgi:hypothetical protein